MALIYSYKEKASLTGSELIIGSDMNQYKNPSVSIKLSTVKDYTADQILQGDSPYVPVFDAVTDTLSNSIIQQNSNNPIDGISIGGAIDAVTNIAASGNLVVQGDVTGGNNINIGTPNTVSGSRAGTIGNNNTVAGDDAFSVGHSAHALGNEAISLGHGTSAAGHGSLAAGYYASAGNEGAASYTASVTSTTFTVDNLVGTLTTGMYVYPFNVNERKEITNVVDNGNGTYDITVAGGAVTTYADVRVYFESATPDRNDTYGTIALGNEATSIGSNSIAIGYKATATTSGEVVIGSSAADTTVGGNLNITGAATGTTMSVDTSLTVGGTNNVSGSRSGTIGNQNTVAGDDAFSAGHASHALGNDSISLGHGSSAAGHGSLAAGFYASAGNEGSASYTASVVSNTFTVDNLVGTLATGMYVYPFNINERREITNVVNNGDGTYDITVAGTPVTTYDNVRIYFESAVPDRDDNYGCVALGNEATSISNNSIAIGYKATATNSNEIVIGSSVADTAIGGDLNVIGDLNITGAVTGTSFAEITSGTWTPTLGTNPGGSIVYTYTTQTGNWYAVGDMVIANFQIIGFASGVSSSDIVTISMPHDPAYDEPGGTVYDAGTGFSVKPIGFGRSFSSSHAGASILGVSGEILTAAEVNFSQQFNILGQLIYKK